MTDAPWYPVDTSHPPPLAQVRGIVMMPEGFDVEITISRGAPPHVSKWAEWKSGRATPLAPGATPCLWQPQFPDKWRGPLPEPVPSVSPRMWSETTRFQLVEEATAAELAQEMERDRADARRGGVAPGERTGPELPWWRDADKIRYEPVGYITPRMAEGRVKRALALCEHRRGTSLQYRSFSTVLADIAAHGDEPAYATSDFVPRLVALPADIKDFPIAMGWFVALNPLPVPDVIARADWDNFNDPQESLYFRSINIPLSFEDIGSSRRPAVSGESVRRMHDRAIRRICRIANGIAVSHAGEQIEALRERNRAWKRKGHDPVSIHEAAISALGAKTR